MDTKGCVIDPGAVITGSGFLENVRVGPRARIHGMCLVMSGGSVDGTLEGNSLIQGDVHITGSVYSRCYINGKSIEISGTISNCHVSGERVKMTQYANAASVIGNDIEINCALEGHVINRGKWDNQPILIRGEGLYEVQEAGDRLIRVGCTTLSLEEWKRQHLGMVKGNHCCWEEALRFYRRAFKFICEVRGWATTLDFN